MPWTNVWFWLFSFIFILITSVLAGSYPALYLSSFNPIKALKGTFRVGSLAALPRKILVVFQFSISVILIIGTAIVYQQIQYAKDRPVGYDREGMIMIQKKSNAFDGKYAVLRNELKNTGAVFEVSESMGPVTEVVSGNGGWEWKGGNMNFDKSLATLAVSHTHGKTAGWKFIEGRDFDLDIPGDSSGLVINETAAKLMNLDNPVGEEVTWTWWMDTSQKMNYKILGVVKDMVMDSPYAPAEPTVFYLRGFNGTPNWINVRVNPQVSMSEALPKIESVFKKVIPSVPFEYKFVDEEYAMKFGKEERIGRLASIFAALAIFISCLGLIGLASFVAEQRTKEIGIRKVLGASIAGLWKMLSQDFVLLIVISCFIATPLAYYFLDGWLQKFQYRITVSAWIFLLTGGGAVLLALLTVSYQAIKTALMNPVKSLRSE
jgi:putative ABC transport system permease protein